jgi:hypothetical protein
LTVTNIITFIVAILGSSAFTILWKHFMGKKRENAEVNTLIVGGAKITLEMSDTINKAIEQKTHERTAELREMIAANEVKHYKEVSAQGAVYAKNMAKSEEMYERKIQVLYMKIERIEANFNTQIGKLEGDLTKEIDIRTNCLRELEELKRQVAANSLKIKDKDCE